MPNRPLGISQHHQMQHPFSPLFWTSEPKTRNEKERKEKVIGALNMRRLSLTPSILSSTQCPTKAYQSVLPPDITQHNRKKRKESSENREHPPEEENLNWSSFKLLPSEKWLGKWVINMKTERNIPSHVLIDAKKIYTLIQTMGASWLGLGSSKTGSG